ncbi:MAG: hypothetical protein R3F11_20245 [Verrucomicrobiales bacterium]
MAEEMQDLPDLAEDATPEQVFDRQWAAELVRGRSRRCGRPMRGAGRIGSRRCAAFCLARETASATSAYSEVAAALGASEGAVKKAAHDLRAACCPSSRRRSAPRSGPRKTPRKSCATRHRHVRPLAPW